MAAPSRSLGPLAVRLALEAVDQGLEMTLEEGLLLEANHFGLLAATQDMKEGLTAFLEKRSAKFQGGCPYCSSRPVSANASGRALRSFRSRSTIRRWSPAAPPPLAVRC